MACGSPAETNGPAGVAHAVTVRVSDRPGKRSGCSTKPVDLAEPPDDLVPTRQHWGRSPFYVNPFEQPPVVGLPCIGRGDPGGCRSYHPPR